MDDSGWRCVAIDDLPQIWDGWAKLVRAGLDITAFGVQIIDFPPDYTSRSHDEADSGQEELYLALQGAGEIVIGDDEARLTLDPDHVIKVEPGVERKVATGAEGVRLLCVGSVPGRGYTPPEWTKEPTD